MRELLASGNLIRAGAFFAVAVTAVAVFALAAPVASGLVVIALIPAMAVDIREGRIPNHWVGLAVVSFVSAVAISAVLGYPVSQRSIIVGAVAMALPILLLHLVSPAAMGFGDVKAALVLGAALGAVDWQLALVGLTLASGIAATVGILSRTRTIAFGPYLLLGTLIALTANPFLLESTSIGGIR